MNQLFGTSRGLNPAHSPSGLGETELVITDTSVSMSHANGLEIVHLIDGGIESLVELSREQIIALFADGANLTDTWGLRYANSGVTFLLLPDEDDAPRLRVGGLLIDQVFGPYYLYAPDQVKAGKFDRALTRIEERLGPNAVPRLP